ncbi:Kynurenine formamidase [Diaporthe australafricana]|uniref:Kynurenine formamidase n=1 Tax=Diaporthe australafricana TaxID=127596 RepID=A0ABR3WC79_9PEZI
MTDSLRRTEYYYGKDNVLQNVAVWEFPEDKIAEPAPGATKYWLIFIHGGAWRDPRSTFSEAEPTINALLDPSSRWHIPDAPSRVAGFASLNYRLSPHPSFTQDAATTPSFATRTARHPDHLADVLTGLRFLQRRLGLGGDYVLFGHSAGAMLAYQALLGTACLGGADLSSSSSSAADDVTLPAAVVGFEGIYDLVGLDGRMGGGYAGFMEAAFGADRGAWRDASPATAKGSFGAWTGGRGPRLAVLAQSVGDELVDMPEVGTMEGRLREDGVRDLLVFRDLEGGHFDVLNDGSFARVLIKTLEELGRLKSLEK